MKKYLLSIFILPIIIVLNAVSYWLYQVQQVEWIFNGLFFLPGLIFALLVWLFKHPKALSGSGAFKYLISSTLLYLFVFIVSMTTNWFGICVFPGLGAFIFISIQAYYFKISFSTTAYGMSLFAGPVSGGLTILIMESNAGYGSLFFLPIMIWWIFMSILIDQTTQKKTHNV
jgi:hypothetical protein